jgi:hypothetical protein
MSPISRLGKSLILTSVAVLAMSGVVYASDDVVDNIGVSGPGNAPGILNLTATGTAVVKYQIVADGACDATASTPATVVISATPSAGLTIFPSTLTFTSCGVDQDVTYTGANATTVATTHSVTAAGDIPAASGGDRNIGSQDARLTVNVGAGSTTPTNPAPTVSVPAADALGIEGDILSTTGTFADDAAFASISPSSNVGTFNAILATGVWTWSLPTTDDVATADLTVTATDAGGLTVSDTFSYGAANEKPVIGAIDVHQTDACSITLSAVFGDVGLGDTHVSSIAWGDGTDTGLPTADTSPVEGLHTYSSNGTFIANVTVTDDDGGSDTKSAAGFTTQNTASAIMQPINTTGNRSVFKLGSTIPVKITVTGCDRAAVTNLSPTVTLLKLDGTPNPGDLETATSTVATNGLAMRWSDTQYIYNLSTKLSQQFNNTALTAGSYRVSVDDSSFYSRTTADFELKK